MVFWTKLLKENSINYMAKKKIVVIGGGTGTFTVLTGLRKYPQLDLSVIVSMMDSGGSNRVIRDEFGLLPTSDLRQCMVALSDEHPGELIRNLFTYRYSSGTGITGMTFGNLFMAALTDIYGSQEVAIQKTCEFLDVRGEILPVTFDNTNLVARYDNGKQVLGEHSIDEPGVDVVNHKIVELAVFPPANPNKMALAAISKADMIVLGPGDLYTSVLCNLVIDGFSKEVAKSRAKKVYALNLMSRVGQTTNFTALDHVNEVENYLGKNVLDFILVNNGKFPEDVLLKYQEENTFPVKDDLGSPKNYQVIRSDFVGKKSVEKDNSDKLVRSLIRHDSDKLAKAIVSLL